MAASECRARHVAEIVCVVCGFTDRVGVRVFCGTEVLRLFLCGSEAVEVPCCGLECDRLAAGCGIGRCSVEGSVEAAMAAASPCVRVLRIELEGTINSLRRVLPVGGFL